MIRAVQSGGTLLKKISSIKRSRALLLGRRVFIMYWDDERCGGYRGDHHHIFFFFFLRPTHIYLLRILNIQRMKHAPISVFSFTNFSEWKGESRRDVFNIANSLPVVFGRYVHVSLSLSSSSSYLWFFWSRNRRKWEGSSFVMNFNIFCLEFHGFLIVFERFDVENWGGLWGYVNLDKIRKNNLVI